MRHKCRDLAVMITFTLSFSILPVNPKVESMSEARTEKAIEYPYKGSLKFTDKGDFEKTHKVEDEPKVQTEKTVTYPYDELSKFVDMEGLKKVYNEIFNKSLFKVDAKVVSKEEAKNIPVALTKLDNGKTAYMVDGKPFYPIAIETGWWDTRVDDNGFLDNENPANVGDKFKEISDEEWDQYFSDMNSMGFNTVQLMIYWRDWEPERGKYDFSFLDNVTNIAAENGLKTEFVIFFHSQTDHQARETEDFWAYHLDNKTINGKDYSLSMQWGENLTSAKDFRDNRDKYPTVAGKENFLEYWHPQIFKSMNNALTALAEHFKDSSNIIGYQLGNEEGFNYYTDNGNDRNPYYLALEEMWIMDNPNGDINKFRADVVNKLWINFNNAIHKGDPYKPTTTNTQGGEAEKQNKTYGQRTPDGMTLDIYKSVDMVGSMFYGSAKSIYKNLDNVYSGKDNQNYAKGFPILFPTEISATLNEGSVAKQITAQTIARGGQGFGLYCYGELYNDFERNGTSKPKPVLSTIKTLVKTIKDVEDLVYGGIPVSENNRQNIFMNIHNITGQPIEQGDATLSMLETDANNSLGILHFGGNANNTSKVPEAAEKRTVRVGFSVREAGMYELTLYKTDGTKETLKISANDPSRKEYFSIETTGLDVTYIAVKKL